MVGLNKSLLSPILALALWSSAQLARAPPKTKPCQNDWTDEQRSSKFHVFWENLKASNEDKKADSCLRRWRSGQCPFAPWWSSSTSLGGCVWGCQSRNIIPRGRRQTNWVTKTISSLGNPSFNSPCAETLIREFTSNAFSKGQVHHLYLIYLTWCKYCWSFMVDLARPHFSEVHAQIKLLKTVAVCRWSGGMQITHIFIQRGCH